MVFEIDSNLVDTGVVPFEIWAKDNAEQICKYYNPIRESESIEIIDIDLQEVISKAEAYEILADDLSYKDDGTALGREQRLKYLKILKP
jgi:hypothetical protein